jgi:hypothetical protein
VGEILHFDMLEAGQLRHLYNRFLCEAVFKRRSLLSIRIDCIILLSIFRAALTRHTLGGILTVIFLQNTIKVRCLLNH